jgi:hypothetical protein
MSVIDAAADGDSVIQWFAAAEYERLIPPPGGGGLGPLPSWIDEERVKREALQRVLAREMSAYSRWRDFSMTAREQWQRAHDAHCQPHDVGKPAKLPYPRWPHGVL